MANGTHSGDRGKDEENSNGRPRRNGEKGKINSSSSVSDTSGVRRSPRKTSSKNMIPSHSSTHKSKALEKRTALTPAVRRKSERVEKQNMPSPLRRSGRTRSHSSVSPSDSKSSGSLNSEQKPKKEKSVKQLTFEAKEVNENEEHDLGTSQVAIKRMDARLYRSMFQKPKNGNIAGCVVSFLFLPLCLVSHGIVTYPNVIKAMLIWWLKLHALSLYKCVAECASNIGPFFKSLVTR